MFIERWDFSSLLLPEMKDFLANCPVILHTKLKHSNIILFAVFFVFFLMQSCRVMKPSQPKSFSHHRLFYRVFFRWSLDHYMLDVNFRNVQCQSLQVIQTICHYMGGKGSRCVASHCVWPAVVFSVDSFTLQRLWRYFNDVDQHVILKSKEVSHMSLAQMQLNFVPFRIRKNSYFPHIMDQLVFILKSTNVRIFRSGKVV